MWDIYVQWKFTYIFNWDIREWECTCFTRDLHVTRVSVLLFKLECTINTIIYTHIYIYSDGFIYYVSWLLLEFCQKYKYIIQTLISSCNFLGCCYKTLTKTAWLVLLILVDLMTITVQNVLIWTLFKWLLGIVWFDLGWYCVFSCVQLLLVHVARRVHDVMISVVASSAVDAPFEPRSSQTKDYENWYLLPLSWPHSIKEKEQTQ
jgi:hypothetical protein